MVSRALELTVDVWRGRSAGNADFAHKSAGGGGVNGDLFRKLRADAHF